MPAAGGIGAALLKWSVQMYWQPDYRLLFGGCEAGCNLGAYDTRHGFTVLRSGRTVDVGTLPAGLPVRLERFFQRWRGRASPDGSDRLAAQQVGAGVGEREGAVEPVHQRRV